MISQELYLEDYIQLVMKTNKFPDNEVVLSAKMGLFGEIGSFLAIYKKMARGEKSNLVKAKKDVVEELGDIFWYFILLCIKSKIDLNKLLSTFQHNELEKNGKKLTLVTNFASAPFVQVIDETDQLPTLDSHDLLVTSKILLELIESDEIEVYFQNFFINYLSIINKLNISLKEILEANILKINDRFIPIEELDLSFYEFDRGFSEDESFEKIFKIEFVTKANKKSYMKLNNVFIGDALNNNHRDDDGYKYHDVFHLAFATVLHWSPTFRALIKHKRKSNPQIDETEDSGRAIVIEEGLSAWLFAKHKLDKIDLTNENNITYGMLKTIREFVHGYEVEKCPLQLWVSAITQGYSVFNQLSFHKGGIVKCDLVNRKITFLPNKTD